MTTGIILAGGKNSRIKLDKAFVKVGHDRMIDRTVKLFNGLFDEVIVVANTPDKYAYLDAKIVEDILAGNGSLGGIHAGLKHSKSFYNFVVGCDMPFLDKGLISYMISIKGFDIVIPRIDDKHETLFAVYSKKCICCIEDMIKENRLKILDLFDYAKVSFVEEKKIDEYDPKHLSFVNINTEEDLKNAKETQFK